jgi:hypothetical protein
MDELAEFLQILGESEFKPKPSKGVNRLINELAMLLMSSNAGYITGQVIYFVFDGWFW